LPDCLSQGDFAPLLGWLRPRVHERASSATTGEIVHDATGAPFSAAAYQRHLRRRYLGEA
jgi:carboxypeptidase Taq